MDVFARIARVYGWTHHEILQLSTRLFFSYFKKCDRFDAEEQLMHYQAAVFANQKKDVVNKMFKHLKSRIEPGKVKKVSKKENIDRSWNILRKGAL